MGGTKTTTQQTYQGTNSYGYQPGAESADIDAVRNFKISADPRIPYAFANAKRNIAGTYRNPLGANQTSATRDASQRATYQDLAQQESEASNESYQGTQGARLGQAIAVAGMTAPRLVQTGQSGSQAGTQNVTTSPIDSIIQGAAGIGSSLIM